MEMFKSKLYKLEEKKTRVAISVKIMSEYQKKFPGKEEVFVDVNEIEDAKQRVKVIEDNFKLDKA